MHAFFTIMFITLVLSHSFHFKSPETEEEFVPLFNGQNLSGWVNVNCAPETWTVSDGMIICSGIPTGVLRTVRQYENFILELEWRHLYKGGNAGLFIHSDAITAQGQPFTRSIECQIMDGNEGDMFAIHGARLIPDNEDPFEKVGWMRSFPKEARMKPTGEWNHYRVESREGMLTLAMNGKAVTRGFHLNPRKGYICLESEGSEVHFRNLRIMELPGTDPIPELNAEEDKGFISLYNGLDLRGWHAGRRSSWKADDWRLVSDAVQNQQWLLSEKEFRNFRLIVDWRLTGEPKASRVPVILADGRQALDEDENKIYIPIRDAGNAFILLRGTGGPAVELTCWPLGSGSILDNNRKRIAVPVMSNDLPPGEWNRFEISLSDNAVNIVLNGKTIIRNYNLGAIQQKGQIGLQHEGYPVEFANIYILEL